MSESIWEDPSSVAKFAGRDPDLRLVELLDDYADPASTQVLDLGCAGGRNSELLARRGFDLYAVDGSRAMVAHTRQRLAEILGEEQAERRVQHGPMSDLSAFASEHFDLVVALGIYHCAASRAEWDAAVGETARVLRRGGRLLVAAFTPETDLEGDGIQPVPGEPHVFDGFSSGRSVLLDQEALDDGMQRFGLETAVPSRTVRVEMAKGRRVTVNGLYVRSPES